MKYKVHKLNIKLAKEPDMLENFLNNLKGEVISIIPDVESSFLFYLNLTTLHLKSPFCTQTR